ncbi:allophanate hydrolase-related protein [Nocardia sp. CDC160]|uniref:allophanate hydrolase-related protein n=1 Tax=Nocardia sp. CDC160 TaxID=3112166 RepID=UPI002DBED809|nr:gamma-glutamylcyclotransferase [Nocardia sp. CDC160]MEC3917933.1 gamma-glutamylcyclotransferase [Nocardia sp. CDC160]
MPLIFLNGGAMRGGPLNYLLEGAPFAGEAKTAAQYRFYSIDDRFPGLHPVAYGGAHISGELFDVPLEVLRNRLLPAKAQELELGVIALDDNRSVLSMMLRLPNLSHPQLIDITDFGSWQSYREESTR